MIFMTWILISCFSEPEVDNEWIESDPDDRPPVTVEKSKILSKKTEHERQIKGDYLDGTVLPCPSNGFLSDFDSERLTPYDDSGSDSGDQFRPAEHPESEEDDLEDWCGSWKRTWRSQIQNNKGEVQERQV